MTRLIATLIILLLIPPAASAAPAATHQPLFAVAILPTPVLNTPDFPAVFGGRDGMTLHLDGSGLIREVEFIALPGSLFRIEEMLRLNGSVVYRVTTDEYPYPTESGYFIDSRFVTTSGTPPPPRTRSLPTREKIIESLLAAQGSRYIWGGNVRGGIPQMFAFFPPAVGALLSSDILDNWELRGVDCSGLLYEATGGFTPRNTSSLVVYGDPVRIAGLDAEEIVRRVEPLDLIVWSGHVMIVVDRERVIESRLDPAGKGGGVVVHPLREAVEKVMESRRPVDDYPAATTAGVKGFVVRRWYPAEKRGE